MILNDNTPKEVISALTPDEVNDIISKISVSENYKSIFTMNCGEFIETTNNDDWFDECYDSSETLFDFLGKIKGRNEDFKNLNKLLDQNKTSLKSNEKEAQRGVVFPSFAESILIDVAQFFNLKNFEEAANVPFSNWLIIHKHNTANAKFQRNLERINDLNRK